MMSGHRLDPSTSTGNSACATLLKSTNLLLVDNEQVRINIRRMIFGA